MSIFQEIKEKQKEKSLRKKRGLGTRHQGATSWSEKRDHTSRLKGFFGTPTGMWLKKDGWALIGIIILVFGSTGYYILSKRITEITISETIFLDSNEVRDSVSTFLDGKRLGVLPNNAYVFTSEESLKESLQSKFEQNYALEGVSVTKVYPDTVEVNITERVPSVTWVAKGKEKGERVYTVDQNGIVTHEIPNRDEANDAYPLIIDQNREDLGIDWQVISPEYIAFVMELHRTFTDTTGYEVKSYVLPKVSCHKQEYVAEEVFKKEIENSDSEELKNKKREIQERFQKGEITIDQSIELLEQINVQNGGDQPDGEKERSQGDVERIEFESVNVPTDCDFVKVGQDVMLNVVEPTSDSTFEIYFDTTHAVEKQLQHVLTILRTQVEDISTIKYIDVRVPDRVYYQ